MNDPLTATHGHRGAAPPATGRFRRVLVAAIAAAGLMALAIPAIDLLRGAALVIRAANIHGAAADLMVGATHHAVSVRDLQVPSRYGALRGRMYQPGRGARRTIILTAGVHAEGIDEPRLVKLARDFAATGYAVVTPELPDLLEYRVSPRLPPMIADTVHFVTRDRAFAPDGRVGLVGISFSGGLSVVAAGRPTIRDLVAFTVSFGGHGDLERTMRYLCTGEQPDGTYRPPHDYGVVIILLNAAPFVVPEAQVERLRAGIRTFLRASHIDMVDHARARTVFEEAIAMEPTLEEPSRTYLHWVNTRDVGKLGPLLLPAVGKVTTDPSLSPERSPAPTSPVFLIHGLDDNVIPAIESTLLAKSLRAHGTRVRLLLSPLITHAELDRTPRLGDVWNLLTFWSAALSR